VAEQTWGIRCRCGLELVGLGEQALVSTVRAHLGEAHPALVGAYSAEDVLSLAYRKPGTHAAR